MIDRQTIDKIMNAADIVDVVSEFVTLKRSGANYKGLCPFHNERTPSFVVSPARGICHCFSCGKGGNAVKFIMEHEQMTYPEALKWLAKKYHIEVKERELSAEEKKQETLRESLFIVNNWAMSYFEDVLNNDIDGKVVGMGYFRGRGFSDDLIAKFHLGYALKSRDAMTKAALKAGYNKDVLATAGLSIRRDDGSMYDRYSDRVIFPWLNVSGRVCAFGGRLLSKETKGVNQKYVNSPDSDVFHKDHELYGLYQAKKAIVREDRVYMVEGYTDVLSMHQCGIENVVANSGTALSLHQIRKLHRFTSNITLLYDGDAAGIHAALRGTDLLLAEGMNIKVLLLPDGDDPDSFARKHTAEEYREYILSHQQDFISFESDVLVKGTERDPVARSQAINTIVKSVSVIPDPITRATYLQECSSRLGIKEETLMRTMNRLIHNDIETRQKRQGSSATAPSPVPAPSAAPASASSPAAPSSANPIEPLLLQLVLKHGEAMEIKDVPDVDGNLFDLTVAQYVQASLAADDLQLSNPIYQRILDEAADHSGIEGFSCVSYFNLYPDAEVQRVVSPLLNVNSFFNDGEEAAHNHRSIRERTDHLLAEYKLYEFDNRIAELKTKIAAAKDAFDTMKKLMGELKDLQLVRNELAKQAGRSINGSGRRGRGAGG